VSEIDPPSVLPYRRAAFGERTDDCYRCGYPLVGIDDEQPCPECGLLARRSRRTTDELHNTRPRWLRRISRGANLILLAIALGALWPALWLGLIQGDAWRFTMRWMRLAIPMLGFDVAAIALLAGTWLLASRENYPPADRADRRLRALLVVAATVPTILVTLIHVQKWWNFQPWAWARVGAVPWWGAWLWQALEWARWTLCTVGVAPLPLLLFARLRGLARRARSAHLAEHCTIVGIGTSAAILFFSLFSLISANASAWGLGSYWTTRSNLSLVMMLVLGTAAILFTLWSLYLFVRFTIAFRRASRELWGRWVMDDRSLPHRPGFAPP
jgi:hypothetical protein